MDKCSITYKIYIIFVKIIRMRIKMDDRFDIHGLQIHNISMKETLERICKMLENNVVQTVFTPNAEIVMQAVRNESLAKILNNADLLLPDGAGVVLGSKILKRPLKEKVSGIDVARGIMKKTEKNNVRFYLFGGKPGVAEKAVVQLYSDYPGIKIAGYRNGYFNTEDTNAIIEEINAVKTDILFVFLGAPKQEMWITENQNKLQCKVAIGLGGSLDVFAGTSKLAPEWMRKAGLEWLYRLIREPYRWKRMLDLPRFVLLTLHVRLAERKMSK